jgi:putative transposase
MSAALAFPMPAAAPFVPATPEWLTKEEIVRRTGISARTLHRYTASGVTISRTMPTRSRNGKPICQYLVSSLPYELRAKLIAVQKLAQKATTLQIVPPAHLSSIQTAPLFAAAPTPPTPRVDIAPERLLQAEARLHAIQPLLDYITDKSSRPRYAGLRLSDGSHVSNARTFSVYLSETVIVEDKRPNTRTLWRWLAQYRVGGLPALARKTRDDAGTSHFFTKYPAARTLVEAEFHKPHATYARAFDALRRERDLLQVPAAELPSYATVRNYLEALPEPMKALARHGLRRYNETCAPHLSRGYEDVQANAIWIADTQIHDALVRNDVFASVATDAPMRLRLVAIEDMRSRKIVGHCWAAEGDWRAIATALRNAAARYGMCEVFYCDNGADFRKAGKGAKWTRPADDSLRQAYTSVADCGAIQQLGAKIQFCIPYAPQSKPIERAFGTLHKRLDAIMPHYTTGNIYTKPDQTVIAAGTHSKLVKLGRGSESALMPASYFIRLANERIEGWYNHHPHRGRGMEGRSPNEVFDALYPVATRRTADPRVLALLLFERQTCTVSRTAVRVNNRRYMPDQASPESWHALHDRNRREIVVAYDPLDPDVAVALDEQGHWMADLEVERLTRHAVGPDVTAEDRANSAHIAASMQMRGRLRKATVATVVQVHRNAANAGFASDLRHTAAAVAANAAATLPLTALVSQRAAVRTADADGHGNTRRMSSEDLGDALAARLASAQERTPDGTHD